VPDALEPHEVILDKAGIECDFQAGGLSDVPGMDEELEGEQAEAAVDALLPERPDHSAIERFRGADLSQTMPC
jgi:hypothetical protein